nr:hypothetical protein [Tanacetum cinerariifolium]
MDVRELYTRSGAVRDEIFSQRYRFRSLDHEQERTAVMFGALWRPVLVLEAWVGRADTRMTDMSRARSHYLSRVSGYDPVLDETIILSKLALPIFLVIKPTGLSLQGMRPTQ